MTFRALYILWVGLSSAMPSLACEAFRKQIAYHTETSFYEAKMHSPKLDPNKPTKILFIVGNNLNRVPSVRKHFREAEYENTVPHEITVVSARDFKTIEAFFDFIEERTADHDVFMLFAHSSPNSIALNDKVHLQAGDLPSMTMAGKHFVFSGCNTGACVWTPELFLKKDVKDHTYLFGSGIDPNTRLVDTAVRRWEPRSVVGTLKDTTLDDHDVLIPYLLRTSDRQGPDWIRAMNQSDPKEQRHFSKKLLAGDEAYQIRFLKTGVAWEKIYGMVDSHLEEHAVTLLSNKNVSLVVKKAALDFFFEHRSDRKALSYAGYLSPEAKVMLFDHYLSKPKFHETMISDLYLLVAGDKYREELLLKKLDADARVGFFMKPDLIKHGTPKWHDFVVDMLNNPLPRTPSTNQNLKAWELIQFLGKTYGPEELQGKLKAFVSDSRSKEFRGLTMPSHLKDDAFLVQLSDYYRIR